VVTIVVDVYEPPALVQALSARGCDVVIRRLSVGDYEVSEGVVVERKTVADFRCSLADGRLWSQVGGLRSARIAYIILEGPDVLPALSDASALRGALLSIADLGITVVRSRDADDTAAWLSLIERRRSAQPLRRRSPHVGRPRTADHPTPVRVLAAIDGISETRAKALLDRFGTVAGVVAASEDALRQTEGLHANLAKRIFDSLH
jgi:Fanconi anemia group M protein